MTSHNDTREKLLARLKAAQSGNGHPTALETNTRVVKVKIKRVPVVTAEQKARLIKTARDPQYKFTRFPIIQLA